VIIAKQGEYGAAMITPDSYFSLPRFRSRGWSTDARGHLRRRLRRYIAAAGAER